MIRRKVAQCGAPPDVIHNVGLNSQKPSQIRIREVNNNYCGSGVELFQV